MARKLPGVVGSLAVVLAACGTRTLADHDNLYSTGPERYVWCSVNIDARDNYDINDISGALSRAEVDRSTLHLYAHVPGETIDPATIDQVLSAAADRHLQLVTYEQLSATAVPGSLALSFDDDNVASWLSIAPLLASHQVHVTFFVAGFLGYSDAKRDQLRQLADAGHDIEYHSTNHLNAEDYANAHGTADYIATDIVPALDAMRAAGYATRTFAYPGGARTIATDEALRPYFDHLRGLASRCPQ